MLMSLAEARQENQRTMSILAVRVCFAHLAAQSRDLPLRYSRISVELPRFGTVVQAPAELPEGLRC
jgi:hypothetical protein